MITHVSATLGTGPLSSAAGGCGPERLRLRSERCQPWRSNSSLGGTWGTGSAGMGSIKMLARQQEGIS
jgi:hypothetical protein